MKDPAMRAAVRDVINRQQIVDNVYEKRADVAQGLLGPALPWAAPLRKTGDQPRCSGKTRRGHNHSGNVQRSCGIA